MAEPDELALGMGIDSATAIWIEGETFRVESSQGGAVWFYEARDPPILHAGEPLTWAGIRRVKWAHGSEGTWPPVIGDESNNGEWPYEELEVQDGSVLLVP